MEAEKQKKLDLKVLLFGVLYVVVAFIFFIKPVFALGSMVIGYGILAIVQGVMQIIGYKKLKDGAGLREKGIIVLGVLNVLLGLFLIFNLIFGILFAGFIFAVWFITESISRLFDSKLFKGRSRVLYFVSVLFNVLSIVIGILLFFQPIVAALTLPIMVGMYFLFSGVERIISGFHKSE